MPILAGSAESEGYHEAPFRIRRLGFRISFGRTEATTGLGYFGQIFGKSLTGIRCRAVDSIIRSAADLG